VDRGHLHHPWYTVREFYPSHHDSIRIAFSRTGRPADANGFSPGLEYLCLRWTHHARWNREKERDHDDRLCLGGRTQWKNSIRGDLPRVPFALSTNHDDYHGGADGNAPYRTGVGRRWRSKAATWPRGCW